MTTSLSELHLVKQQVQEVLEVSTESRNSDKVLWWLIAQEFYGVGDYLTFETFRECPPFESVSRCRRKLNEGGLFLPTDEKIAKQRGLNMEQWKRAMGYYTTPEGQGEMF